MQRLFLVGAVGNSILWLGVRLDRGVDLDELAYCAVAPTSLVVQTGLPEAED